MQEIYALRERIIPWLLKYPQFNPDPDPVAPMSDADIAKMLLDHPDPKWREAGRTGKWRRVPSDVTRRDDARDRNAKSSFTPPDRGAPPIGDEVERPKPNFRTLADFISEFRPISYAVAGLMREGSLYTLTGRTGEGKTALLVKLALAVATGRARN